MLALRVQTLVGVLYQDVLIAMLRIHRKQPIWMMEAVQDTLIMEIIH